jgi:tRNA (adenine22-N1)-methyltransferase
MISKRLRTILAWTAADVIADIGCDHAYIACYAVAKGQAKKAYACDVAQGPLDHARETIEEMGLQQQVIPKLMSGISELPEDVEQIILAGMGAELICKILEQGKEQLKEGQTLLISCHKDVELLRKYLNEHNFCIEKERIIQEERHFYPLLLVCLGKQDLSQAQIYYGIHVKKDEEYIHYLEFEKQKWSKILAKIPQEKNQVIKERLSYIDEKLTQINENH